MLVHECGSKGSRHTPFEIEITVSLGRACRHCRATGTITTWQTQLRRRTGELRSYGRYETSSAMNHHSRDSDFNTPKLRSQLTQSCVQLEESFSF